MKLTVRRCGDVVRGSQVIGRVERRLAGSRIEWAAFDIAGKYLTTQGSRHLATVAVLDRFLQAVKR